MSRGRRRGRDSGGALSSLEQAAADIYKADLPPEIAQLDSQRRPARPIEILEIYPDRTQPRRTVPTAVRQFWDSRPDTVADLFQNWLYEIERMGWLDFDLETYLKQEHLPDGVEGNDEEGDVHTRHLHEYQRVPLLKMLIDLADLAISIRKTGLTNPITVVRMERVYRLETGERRWLAYHLLNIYFPDEDWQRIPAHLVDEISVWRQASENNARADLNAIGRARQLAILLMDLLGERGYEFYTFDEILDSGGSEREYYAQVADGNEFRVPRGEGERLLNAMGLKNPTQIRQYRQLLRLPDDVWQDADDKNLTEGEIRRWLYRNTSYGMEDDDSPTAETNPFVERVNKRRRTRIWEYANRFEELSEEERQQALAAINEDERWLNELRQAIQRRLSGK